MINLKPEQIVQQNIDAYNARDIAAFMSSFADNIQLFNFGLNEPWAQGTAEVRAIYKQLFADSPNLLSVSINRIVFDNKVIDYEYITGRLGKKEAVKMILIYEIEAEKIARITAIKE